MAQQRGSYFALLLSRSVNPKAVCSSLLLAWLAHSDGVLSDDERQMLSSAAASMFQGEDAQRREAIVQELIAIASGNKIDDLVLACKTLRSTLSPDERHAFIDLLISMVLIDNRINLSERYILEFLSDLLDVGPDALNGIFRNNTGKDMPLKGDPSSKMWWEMRTRSQQPGGDAFSRGPVRPPDQYRDAYATLGLDWGATKEDIQKAYRKLAMKYHPDRYQTLGDDAVKRATAAFMRIKQAYDQLSGT